MLKGITKKQIEVLETINEYYEEYGYSPSFREIAKRMNICSSSTIQGHLDKLKASGLVTWTPGQPRTIKILKKESLNEK